MSRRGHLSTKIPQVRLRPAPAPAAGAGTTTRGKRQRDVSPMNEMDAEILRRAMKDTEDEETSTAALRKSSRPWKGVIITFTGVENKAVLTGLAKELGAVVESALTVHVTHVVATGFGSAKYLYAVEHRLPVMTPLWIEDAHTQWIKGEEVDMEEDLDGHRLLPFTGLRIAMSGIEQLDRRKTLIKYITANGGSYSKDLDRQCSHLISAKSTTDNRGKLSEKIKWALREISEREAMKRRGVKIDDEGMKIVYEEWIWDCVAFHGRWKEDYYDAKKPRRAGRVQAEGVINGTLEHPEEKKPVPIDSPMTDTTDSNEPAVVRKRRRSGLDSLVGELISTASASTLKAEPTFPGEIDQQAEAGSTDINALGIRSNSPAIAKAENDRRSSMLHVSRSASFTKSATAGPSKPTTLTLPRGTTSVELNGSLPPTALPAATDPREQTEMQVETEVRNGPVQFFAGVKFSHLIEEQCEGLENALVAHGGMLVKESQRSAGEKVDYVIVRLCSDLRPEIREDEMDTTVVTECWVEGCCFVERLLSPDSHIVFRPLSALMPIPGANKLLVHLSGFSAENTVYMRRLLRAIGGTLSVKLTRQTSHLVSVLPTGQKVEKSREWGVSVVRDSWLLEMARSGSLANDDDHRHPSIVAAAPSGIRTSDLTANMSTVSELGDKVDFTRRILNHSGSPSIPNGVTQSRMLNSQPTHVDAVASGSKSSIHAATASLPAENALSPPKAKTERLLNSASETSFAVPYPLKSGEGKISRHASAPANPESLGVVTPEHGASANAAESMGAKSASTGNLVLGGVGARSGAADEMTEALKKLAEKEGGTPGNRGKIIRRSRPAARIKSSNTRSPHTLASLSPISKRSSPPTPDTIPLSREAMGSIEHGLGPGAGPSSDGADESLKVQYVDVNGVKEKKKLLALFAQNDANNDSTGGRETKRARRR